LPEENFCKYVTGYAQKKIMDDIKLNGRLVGTCTETFHVHVSDKIMSRIRDKSHDVVLIPGRLIGQCTLTSHSKIVSMSIMMLG
jgi:cupin superfamily acireductone dioxygenase involved in methionine salvage